MSKKKEKGRLQMIGREEREDDDEQRRERLK